jgi:hypothetical protein
MPIVFNPNNTFYYTPESTGGIGGISGIGPNIADFMQQQYQWGQNEFNQIQQFNDGVISKMMGLYDRLSGIGNTLMNQYNRYFGPEYAQLVADAKNYASPARIQQAMGAAESGVAQSFNAQRNANISDLQSYGIDPSSGRYAELDAAERAQQAAAQAGAGFQAEQATEATGRALRSEALQLGSVMPSQATGAYNAAQAAAAAGANLQLATAQEGVNLMGSPIQWADVNAQMQRNALLAAGGAGGGGGRGGGGGGGVANGGKAAPTGSPNNVSGGPSTGYQPLPGSGGGGRGGNQQQQNFGPNQWNPNDVLPYSPPAPGTLSQNPFFNPNDPSQQGGGSNIDPGSGQPWDNTGASNLSSYDWSGGTDASGGLGGDLTNSSPFDPSAWGGDTSGSSTDYTGGGDLTNSSPFDPSAWGGDTSGMSTDSSGGGDPYGGMSSGDSSGGDPYSYNSDGYGYGGDPYAGDQGYSDPGYSDSGYAGGGLVRGYDDGGPLYNDYLAVGSQMGFGGAGTDQGSAADLTGAGNYAFGGKVQARQRARSYAGGGITPTTYIDSSMPNADNAYQGFPVDQSDIPSKSDTYSNTYDRLPGGGTVNTGDLPNAPNTVGSPSNPSTPFEPYANNFSAGRGPGGAVNMPGTGWVGYMKQGGKVPYSNSPSDGRQTDDVRARLNNTREPIRLNAGEFIIPRETVRWKGEKFFQDLIAQSRKQRGGGPAHPTMKPALQGQR